MSPDGSKLAVALLPVHRRIGPRIQVFSLATGAGREWVWPGPGWIGEITDVVAGGGAMSWQANNRTLMFEETSRTSRDARQLRLLDTATPGGSLLAASTRVPIPSAQLGPQHKNANLRITVMPLMTGDGTKLVAPTLYQAAPPKMLGFTITEFSVRTGKPIQVVHRRRADSDAAPPPCIG